ncbi:hypothetical protein NMY22_g7625 [Coprinellus aureogranulatus]|nr:hypothetical protein NMY22_g7625 [Coprinellus aureogranulatus]
MLTKVSKLLPNFQRKGSGTATRPTPRLELDSAKHPRVTDPLINDRQALSPLEVPDLLRLIFEFAVNEAVLETRTRTKGLDWGFSQGNRQLSQVARVARIWRDAALEFQFGMFLFNSAMKPDMYPKLVNRIPEFNRIRIDIHEEVGLQTNERLRDKLRLNMSKVVELRLLLSEELKHLGAWNDVLRQAAPALQNLVVYNPSTPSQQCEPLLLSEATSNVRHIHLTNVHACPRKTFDYLSTLRIESTTTCLLLLERISGWLEMSIGFASLTSVHFIGVKGKGVPIQAPGKLQLPPLLKVVEFSGDLLSCVWLCGLTFPKTCSVDVEVTWFGFPQGRSEFTASERAIQGLASHMQDMVQDGSSLQTLETTVNTVSDAGHTEYSYNGSSCFPYKHLSRFCTLRWETGLKTVSLAFASPQYDEDMSMDSAKVHESIFSGLLRTSVGGGPSTNIVVSADTRLILDVECDDLGSLQTYGEILIQYLEGFDRIGKLSIPFFSDRYREHNEIRRARSKLNPSYGVQAVAGSRLLGLKGRGGPINIGNADERKTTPLLNRTPHDAIGLFTDSAPDSARSSEENLFPSLRTICISGMHAEDPQVTPVAHFLERRQGVSEGWRVSGELELNEGAIATHCLTMERGESPKRDLKGIQKQISIAMRPSGMLRGR